MKIRTSLLALLSAFLLIACGGGDDTPLSTAAEVKTAYDAAPSVLESWHAQSKEEQGDVVMMQYRPDFTLQEPFRLVVFYQGRTIYDERRWLIGQGHMIMSDGTDVVLINEYAGSRDSGNSVVLINSQRPTAIQSLPVQVPGQDYVAAVRDIREWRDGWLIISASYIAPWGSTINRWVMYHPKKQEFVDCGELGSNRHPDWGPAASPICRYR